MNLFNTKNLIMLALLASLSLATGMLHAAELVQFSNGSIADANDVNHNFNELAARIQNQTGATGPQGEAGPLSGLNCKDGEVALASGGSWVCGSSGSTGAPVPVGERVRVTIGGIIDDNWQSWTGARANNNYTFVNDGSSTNLTVTGINSNPASLIDEVNLRGVFNFVDAGGLREVTPANFSVSSSKLGNWTDAVVSAELGAVKISKSLVTGDLNSQYMQGSATLAPVILKRKANNDPDAYNWYQEVAQGITLTSMAELTFEIYEDASRTNRYVTYRFSRCIPSGWQRLGNEEQLSLICGNLVMDFANASPVTDWVNTILAFGERNPGIIVDTATHRYDFGSSVATAYVLPVLGVDLSGAITQQFSFQSNVFRVTGQTSGGLFK